MSSSCAKNKVDGCEFVGYQEKWAVQKPDGCQLLENRREERAQALFLNKLFSKLVSPCECVASIKRGVKLRVARAATTRNELVLINQQRLREYLY